MTEKVSRQADLAFARARAAILDHLPSDLILKRYQEAGGSEILSGKFASPESSAALAANTFGFFLNQPGVFSMPMSIVDAGAALEVCLEAQMRFPWRGGYHPWLDVGVTTNDALIGIESKRYEPFRDEKTVEFSDAYLNPVWGPAMGPYERMRDELTSGHRHFMFLNAAQLVKHAFGLRTQAQKRGKVGKLVYLYAEPKAYPDGTAIIEADIIAHREEVRTFANSIAIGQSDVEFLSLTYTELLKTWAASAVPQVRVHASAILERFDI